MFNQMISALLSFAILFSSLFTGAMPVREKLRIVVPEAWELCVGDSRTLECVFSEKVEDRVLEWDVEPESVAKVDKWGRVTALQEGKAKITARGDGFSDSVELNVVTTPTMNKDASTRKVDYAKESLPEVNNLQKLVGRYPMGHPDIPAFVLNSADYKNHQRAITADGAVWEITDYGVLRTDKNAPTSKDVEQRFMGDRYFYSADTTDGKVLAIFPDGKYGIWTVMAGGVTHIDMMVADGTLKAWYLSGVTQDNISRRGMVSDAFVINGRWRGMENDNDGLWTSMYGAGELMRYAELRNDPTATPDELETAKKAAYSAAEAVLFLYYVSMRTGTTEAYVRRYTPTTEIPGTGDYRALSAEALEKGGNPSINTPAKSPAQLFNESMASFTFLNSAKKFINEGFYEPVSPQDWSDPSVTDAEYEKQTRLIEGFPARTYVLDDEGSSLGGSIYWDINSDKTATGVSTKQPGSSGYLINNENMRGHKVDASGEIPERLWNDLIPEGYTVDDIIYKTDTSADELVGHMFIFKLIYDIIAPEDPEIKAILVEAIDKLAQHLSDNNYMLVDATGQPTSWANFSRTMFSLGSCTAEICLHSLVLLDVFKTAAYITGYQKWENEYQMAALDPAYEYAKVAAQHHERMMAAIKYTVGNATVPLLGNVIGALKNTDLVETIYRLVVNYSGEEMAMLAFYSLFQMEDDEKILDYYTQAIDDWWIATQYGENPLWYFIYQLAHPDEDIKDAYGNNIAENAVWSLSRHPADLVMYLASNKNRDDIAQVDLSPITTSLRQSFTYNLKTSKPLPPIEDNPDILSIVKYVLAVGKLDWAVAAPDERDLYRYNTCTYYLDSHYWTHNMQPSTTYTLPYWLGVYHGIIDRTID